MPRDQRAAVVGVARQPCRLAAFLDELRDGLGQRRHHVRGRREAPLAGLLHVLVLVVQVHRQALAVAGAAVEHRLAHEHEAHAGHAFQALAAGRDQRVEAHRAGVDGQRGEAAHRVDDQALAAPLADCGHLGQRVLDAGAGLAVDQDHMRDARLGGQMRSSSTGGRRAGCSSAKGSSVTRRPIIWVSLPARLQ
jgi:hypothetical protein